VVTDRWERWAPLSGIAYVVLFFVAIVLSGDTGDTAEEYSAFYAEGGNRDKQFFAFFLLIGAALVFLWFISALRGILVRAEGERARWTALAFGSGVASAVLLCAAASLFVAPAGVAEEDGFSLDPDAGNLVTSGGYALLVCSIMTAALLVGFVVAAVLLFAIFFLPIFVWLGWMLAVSIVLILRLARVEGWRRPPATGAG
jgi:hypothetical protein